MTLTFGTDNCFKLSTERWAFNVWVVPKIALMINTTTITIDDSASPVTPEITAAAININTIKSLNWFKNIWNPLGRGASGSTFNPYFSWRFSTSLLSKPEVVVFNSSKISLLSFW